MKCLMNALNLLSGRKSRFRYRSAPYCGADLIYAAYEMGIYLMPFPEEVLGVVYPLWETAYWAHDGILVGGEHAFAKVKQQLIDIAGTYGLFGPEFESMSNRVFYARTNNPVVHADGQKDSNQIRQ
jgi:hypothetical protein